MFELSITAINDDDEKPCNLYSLNENGNDLNNINSFKEAFKHKVDKNYNNAKYASRIPNDSFSTMEELLKDTRQASTHDILNDQEDDQMFIIGFRQSLIKTTICYFLFFITVGLLRLIMHWWKHWLLLATHTKCSLDKAEKVLIYETFQEKHTMYYVKDIITIDSEALQEVCSKKENKISQNSKNLIKKLTEREIDAINANCPFKVSHHTTGGKFEYKDSLRFFCCKKLKYIWHDEMKKFIKLTGLDDEVPSSVVLNCKGLSTNEQTLRRIIYGSNEIVIPVRGIATLLFLEVLNPFYVFQVFSVVLWFTYDYYYYATVIIIMSVFGITMSIIQTRKNQKSLSSTLHTHDSVNVLTDNMEEVVMDTRLLVPGDVIEIPSSGCVMQCDAVLISGNAILDESMLTGESVPVTKTPLPYKKDLIYDSREHARHTLFCGTKVIQTRYIGSEKVLVKIINTGYLTSKGCLIRSILYPPPVDYKFEQDSYKFIALLGLVAFAGFFYTLVTKISRGISGTKIAIESLDLITIAVPPALPAAMTVGRMYAQKRLKANNIYCISPRAINVSGSIDCVCFDKTGTLTEDGLDMWGVVPKNVVNQFQIPIKQINRLSYSDHLLCGMVTCHSITIMNGELRGDPLDLKMFESTCWILEEADVSDATKYDLLFPTVVKPPKSDTEGEDLHDIGIVREFTFTSALQRMAVITRKLTDDHFNVYCKGSPEMVHSLCKPESIPVDFYTTLDYYAQQGYRIIAVAYKALEKKINYSKVQRISREKVECDLLFLGFVVLENRLKTDTVEVIKSLMAANVRTIMVTGDNLLTAISVAKDCEMVTHSQNVIIVNEKLIHSNPEQYQIYYTFTGNPDNNLYTPNDENNFLDNNSISSVETIDTCTQSTHLSNTHSIQDIENGAQVPHHSYRFALSGKTWSIITEHFRELIPTIITRGTIFARMSPDQKQQLIIELQNLGYYVAMCGDGANDCGALKAAHTGISLSESEASIASPFTSKNPTIACVPKVIKEGRAALVTSFGIFKYMAAYSLIQFISVLILYSIDSNLTDMEFLYIDLFQISIFAFFFGKTESSDGPLVKQTPSNSLISFSPILSLALHLIVAITFQVIGWYHVQMQPWFQPFIYDDKADVGNNLGCHQNYTIFAITCFQYIILAVIFSKGAPYRKSIISNYGFIISIVLNLFFSIYLIINPPEFFVKNFMLVLPPDWNFRIYLVIYGLLNFIISTFIEIFIIDFIVFKKLRYKWHNVHKSRRKYLAIEHSLANKSMWPPISIYDVYSKNKQSSDSLTDFKEISPISYTKLSVETTQYADNSSILNNFFLASSDNNETNNG